VGRACVCVCVRASDGYCLSKCHRNLSKLLHFVHVTFVAYILRFFSPDATTPSGVVACIEGPLNPCGVLAGKPEGTGDLVRPQHGGQRIILKCIYKK